MISSAIIDATANQIRPSSAPIDRDISLNSGWNRPTQFAVAMLDSVPTNGTVSIDFSQYEDFTISLYIVGGEFSIEESLGQNLFRFFQSGSWKPTEDVSAYLTYSSWDGFKFQAKKNGLDVFEGEKITDTMKIPVSSMNLSESLVFRFGTRLEQMLTQLGLTTKEELIQFAKDSGFYTDELLQTIDRAEIAPCIYITGSDEGGLLISPLMDKVLIVITPTLDPDDDSQQDPLTIDPNWIANVELNASKVLSWKEPEGLEDGTYLKIVNGHCSIYGLNCRQGDHVLVYDNGTKGILIAGRG